MSDPRAYSRATDEAAEWFARLNTPSISTAALVEFRSWRRAPENAAAYAEVERVWRSSEALARDPEIDAALVEVRRRSDRERALRSKWRAFLLRFAGGTAVAAALVGVIIAIGSGRFADRSYETAVGEQSGLSLADGSKVRLDTNSRISVRFSSRARTIRLERGRAFFDIAHESDRPMSVIVGGAVVRDLGTQFDVRRDGPEVQVTLISGAVRIDTDGARHHWRLTPGQQMTAGPAFQPPHSVDLNTTTSWTSGRLMFDDLPLAAAVAEMNRYGAHKIVLETLGDVRVSGSFEGPDTSGFLSAVTRLYDLQARTRADGDIVLSARSPEHSA